MEEQQIEPIKPFFGPPMSPEIFANKWYEKFCNLLNRHYLRPMQQAERNPVWMCELATLGVVHIRQFFSEALELSLKHKDYPSKGGPAISENQLPPWPLRTADDLLKSMRENPVEQAQFVTFRVDNWRE
ncbi:hypothetical protein PRZ48_013555 [Zasmidium cellare]|uniref:Uncharacterized protein n=1 Tax=Zasmidium cellare TaxID=395010 RepID=A0ABR0E1C8_ZASCE|nr:hypothetical protein PRZ48_013555 [Zasmidium cellare]